MVQENGYWQIEWRGKMAICHIFAPHGRGKTVDTREMIGWLDEYGFGGMYNRSAIELLVRQRKNVAFELGASDGIEFSESLDLNCNANGTEAVCRFYPPSMGGNRITASDFSEFLKGNNIVYGIQQSVIDEFLVHPVYCTDIVIAKGVEVPKECPDPVEYFFNTKPDGKPAYNEDGSVNFHDLSILCQVKKGDLLARVRDTKDFPSGKDVFGNNILSPGALRSANLAAGKNVTLSDDRKKAYANVSGRVTLSNGKIEVADVYEVNGDVDNSTGDINFNGGVYVHGNVRTGFCIRAKDDVVVDGVVEGAIIESEGQIIIKRGVHGNGKARLSASRGVFSRFIESSYVKAGDNIESGAIIHSSVSAGGDIVCNDKKGYIAGGTVVAGGNVEAQTIGNQMQVSTRIVAGYEPKQITPTNAETGNANIVRGFEKSVQINAISIDDETSAIKIEVSKDIYPGVKVSIKGLEYSFASTRSHCNIVVKGGQIAFLDS